jgi:hypothetical protein
MFLPILTHWVGEALGRDVRIFLDVQIETGAVWSEKLTEALTRSRVLVPILSGQYFNSPWCKAELAHMIAREAKYGTNDLIIPVILYGRDDFPDAVKRIQCLNLQDVANPFMSYSSPTYEKLSEKIRDWVSDVANAIIRAPSYDPTWQQLAIDEFIQQFNISSSKQISVPRFY